MSEAQAKENLDNEIDNEAVDDPNKENEAAEEVEIIVEGEEEPTSKPSTPKGFIKRINKLNGKVEAANNEADEVKRENATLREELNVYRLGVGGKDSSDSAPDPGDFESDAEFEAAETKYRNSQMETQTREAVKGALADRDTANTQEAINQEVDTKIRGHYERAEALNVPDYEAIEDNAIAIFGKNAVKLIAAKSPHSEKLLYNLGLPQNEAKARKFAELLNQDLASGLMELGGYALTLKVRPKHSKTPDPETKLEGGESGSAEHWTRKLDKARENAATGKGTMKDISEIKKEAKAAGVKL